MAKARRGRGEGGCFQRESDGRWVATLSLGFHPGTGKRRRITAYGRTKKAALDGLAEKRAKAGVAAAADPAAGRMTVGELVGRWLTQFGTRAAAATLEAREMLAGKHLTPRLGRLRLDKLTPGHLERWYADLRADGVGAATARAAADLMALCLRYAVRSGWLAVSPQDRVRKPKARRRVPVPLDEVQARAVVAAAAGATGGDLVVTALGTGCRQGELLALEWPDLDLKAGTLSVTKSLSKPKSGFVVKPPKTPSSRRVVHLPGPLVELLIARKAAALAAGRLDRPVFCTNRGGYQHRPNVLSQFKRIVHRANDALRAAGGADAKPVPPTFTFHDLRHAHASLLLSAGHSLRAVSQRLGHSNPALTLKLYAHCLPTDDAKLADGMARLLG